MERALQRAHELVGPFLRRKEVRRLAAVRTVLFFGVKCHCFFPDYEPS